MSQKRRGDQRKIIITELTTPLISHVRNAWIIDLKLVLRDALLIQPGNLIADVRRNLCPTRSCCDRSL